MPTVFDFERPISELETKIEELKQFSAEKGLDLKHEIEVLAERAATLKKTIYGDLSPWQKVLIARHPDRLGSRDYIESFCSEFIELHGDRAFGDDPAVIGGIGRMNGYVVTVVGHQKGRDTKENLARNFGMIHPEGCRKVLRLARQAEKFQRPLICLIDTPGAHCGIGAEERGQAEAIARNISALSTLRVPIVVVVIGEGGSGGALALGIGDRLLMQEHAVFSVSSPEACASILWKDAGRAREAAEVLKMTAQDLLSLGVIDEIVPEPLGGVHRDPGQAVEMLRESLFRNLDELCRMDLEQLLQARYHKYRTIGNL
ncbi:acetyl-CoA carboxylase carboxyltransferase subunit alpha [Candidatus Desulforudis audaxviator]|uniref:Acetyl-coenzyme A carboxylase carboxyl transferase subunit alpha n=1 Tax=Desulforudis audaxviator (strain MP104C) TaxID=477974 RepID=B1I3G8_DESAP|nr:acetyl-CoA carboxylase carboxyltransferase subunit alpha [Candidatus Desulforudis audaxviator]ACA59566.1 acetyl-CoA carboxylase, carboxyl transferase, alpha subunit [Candidatus Desulforudis audaxviator MP104C]AZK59550.1 Acetyl-coenzyme A carboxyl transferase alpha chain [Candidatus Desulforudis audaxviator]